jgi:hypothetical protein
MELVVNPQSKLTAAPRVKLDGVDDTVTFAATGSGPRARSVVAHQCQPLLGPFRARYLLYGVVAGLAAMALQFVAIDWPGRDEQPAKAVSQAAPPSASAPIDPQLFQRLPQPAIEGPPESLGQPRLDELLARATGGGAGGHAIAARRIAGHQGHRRQVCDTRCPSRQTRRT